MGTWKSFTLGEEAQLFSADGNEQKYVTMKINTIMY